MRISWIVRDPVAVKELSGIARRWQTYAARVVYVALLALIVWNYTRTLQRFSEYYIRSGYAQMARQLFQSFMLLQLAVVVLSAISAASDLVTKEVRVGTLGILVCSPLSAWSIACGKWKAAMAQTATLLLCGAPVLGICVYLGGATPRDLLYTLCVSAAASALAAAVSLLLSSLLRSPAIVLVVSICLFAMYAILPLAFFHGPGNSAPGDFLLACGHLLYTLVFAGPDMGTRLPGLCNAWIVACGLNTALALILVRWAASRIAILSLRTPAPALVSRVFGGMDRFYARINPRGIVFFAGRESVWESHALLWKELQTRTTGRLRNSVRISVLLLLILSLTFWWGVQYLQWPLWGLTLLLWFLCLSNGASLFVKEKEERKWDILLATPLTTREILWSKLCAGIVPMLPLLVIVAFFWLTCLYTRVYRVEHVLMSALSMGLPAVLAYLLGAVCSLRARSLRGAFLTSFGILLSMVFLGPRIVAEFPGFRWHDVQGITPFPYMDIWTNIDSRSTGWTHDSFEGENLVLFVAAYLTAEIVLLTSLFMRFARIAGRSG